MAGWVTSMMGGSTDADDFVPEPTTQDPNDVRAVLKAVVRPLKARQWGNVFSDIHPPTARKQCGACGKFLLVGDDYYKTPHFPKCMMVDLIQLAEELTAKSFPFKRDK